MIKKKITLNAETLYFFRFTFLSRMRLAVNVVAVIFLVSCFINFTISVPVPSKDDEKDVVDDPCDLLELADIPKCEDNDKECASNNEENHEKRQKLCASNPTCEYCESLIPENLVDDDVIEPEIMLPLELIISDLTSNKTIDVDLDSYPRKLVERNIIIENDNDTQYYRGFVESAANVTTIIRLTNVIENHNIVNMPTTLNNTNVNKIHIYQNKTSEHGGKFGLGYTEKGPCCYSVLPKSCKQSTAGTKCRHKRQKVCGRQCTKKVIHPQKNACAYTPQWPYVSCPQNQYPPSNVPPMQYPPFYPGYFPPGYPPSYPGSYPQNPSFSDEFDDDDDGIPLFPDDEELNNPENGWVVSPEKCKVVSEDGLEISNCTQKGFEFDHPYAQNTVSEPIKRNTRHANFPAQQSSYPNQMMQMQPMMYVPVYYQPMPVFMPPQYYAQPPMIEGYQPQQIPLPMFDDYENDQELNDINPYQKPRKHAKKQHPIVMDIDEEL